MKKSEQHASNNAILQQNGVTELDEKSESITSIIIGCLYFLGVIIYFTGFITMFFDIELGVDMILWGAYGGFFAPMIFSFIVTIFKAIGDILFGKGEEKR